MSTSCVARAPYQSLPVPSRLFPYPVQYMISIYLTTGERTSASVAWSAAWSSGSAAPRESRFRAASSYVVTQAASTRASTGSSYGNRGLSDEYKYKRVTGDRRDSELQRCGVVVLSCLDGVGAGGLGAHCVFSLFFSLPRSLSSFLSLFFLSLSRIFISFFLCSCFLFYFSFSISLSLSFSLSLSSSFRSRSLSFSLFLVLSLLFFLFFFCHVALLSFWAKQKRKCCGTYSY